MLVLYPLLGATFVVGFLLDLDKYFTIEYIHVLLNGSVVCLSFLCNRTFLKELESHDFLNEVVLLFRWS